MDMGVDRYRERGNKVGRLSQGRMGVLHKSLHLPHYATGTTLATGTTQLGHSFHG